MDLINPFGPTDVVREYKVGQDMAFAQVSAGGYGNIQSLGAEEGSEHGNNSGGPIGLCHQGPLRGGKCGFRRHGREEFRQQDHRRGWERPPWRRGMARRHNIHHAPGRIFATALCFGSDQPRLLMELVGQELVRVHSRPFTAASARTITEWLSPTRTSSKKSAKAYSSRLPNGMGTQASASSCTRCLTPT